ncbi:MAG: hypothetical protein R2748_23645 [Bryobacterales bacterium]
MLRLSPEVPLENGVPIWILIANHRAVAPYTGVSDVEALFEVKADQSDDVLVKMQAQPELRASLRAVVRCTDPGSGDELACPDVVYTNWSDLGQKYADVVWNGSSFRMEGSWASEPTPSGDRWLYTEGASRGRTTRRRKPSAAPLGTEDSRADRNPVPARAIASRRSLVPLLLFDGVNFEIRKRRPRAYL